MAKIESLSSSKSKLDCFNSSRVASLKDSSRSHSSSNHYNNHLECKHITNSNSSSVLRLEVDKRKGKITIPIAVISMNN